MAGLSIWIPPAIAVVALLILGSALVGYLRSTRQRQHPRTLPSEPWLRPDECKHPAEFRTTLATKHLGDMGILWDRTYRCAACGKVWTRREGY